MPTKSTATGRNKKSAETGKSAPLETESAGPELRERTSPVQYSSPPTGHAAYEDQLGTESRLLQQHVSATARFMDTLAPAETRNTTGRRNELVRGVLASAEFQQQLLADGMPNRATLIITTGVAKRRKEYRESNMHKTAIGRAVYNGLLDAALCMLDELKEKGDVTAVAAALGFDAKAMFEIRERLAGKTVHGILDVTRSRRCTAVVMRALNSSVLNAHKPDRHLHSEKIADQLMQELCMCVAVFTCVDTRGHRFWLARPVQSPEIVPANQPFTCSLSEVKFNPGERIMKVQWYERLDGHSSVFEFRPDLGDFYISTDMLRAGLKEDPVGLVPRDRRGRHQKRQYFDLQLESHNRIIDLIEHVFKDRSSEY